MITILISAMLAATSPSKWIAVLPTDSKKPAVAYDASSLMRSVGGVTVWVRYTYPTGAVAKDQSEFNCARRLRRILYTVEYNADGGIKDQGEALGPWRPIVPDTDGQAVFEKVCN